MNDYSLCSITLLMNFYMVFDFFPFLYRLYFYVSLKGKLYIKLTWKPGHGLVWFPNVWHMTMSVGCQHTVHKMLQKTNFRSIDRNYHM